MKDFREIVKENKKRALSIAVATAFLFSGIVLVGVHQIRSLLIAVIL